MSISANHDDNKLKTFFFVFFPDKKSESETPSERGGSNSGSGIQTLDSQAEQYLTNEKKNVVVDSFVKWRITDVARFYISTQGNERIALNRLDSIVKDHRNNVIVGDLQFLLDFAIVGHAKCGTSTMMEWLGLHGQISCFAGETPHVSAKTIVRTVSSPPQ